MSLSELKQRLSGFARVTEVFQDKWVRGHLISDHAVFEMTFDERVRGNKLGLPGTDVMFLQVSLPRRDVFEFWLGKVCHKPQSQIEFAQYVAPFITRLRGYHFDHSGSLSLYDQMLLAGRF